jgi:type II secretory pathway pseudopilin PulG
MVTRFEQNQRPRSSAAFTLVEIVVGLGLLGIMMAAFFTALASGFSIVNAARQDLRATQIVTQKTEDVRLCTWAQLQSLPTNFQDYYYSAGAVSNTPSVTYYGTISVGPPTTCITNTVSYYSNIDLVTINLVWTNNFGGHSIVENRSMQTLVAYHGLVNYIYGSGFVQQ